ncbi:hypothetical protein IWQ62_001754 [Dispira parvispora]|uniref:peptidyl-tRNA hydrolase n=1 Tax=Dispira parvispora TaxID=1520584 RepID=A0A9W8AXL9_9FUNG|nr:hypothetical protein IWQ62_001754 [Dispira parvispora]
MSESQTGALDASTFTLWQVMLASVVSLLVGLSYSALSSPTANPASSLTKVAATRLTADYDEDSGSEMEPLDEDLKLVLVIRKDLEMSKGKVAAQCCHATLGCYQRINKTNPKMLQAWEYTGQAKVTVKCDDEKDMLALQEHARSLGLTCYSVRDAGRTQIPAGSRTVLGIGPGPISLVNQVTGRLKLY